MGINFSLKQNLEPIMTTTQLPDGEDSELDAMASVLKVLKELDGASRQRVLDYVSKRLGMPLAGTPTSSGSESLRTTGRADPPMESPPTEESTGEYDGISPVAIKWSRRNGLNIQELSEIYSLWADEIDLVAKHIPDKSKKARTRNVALLKAVAEYLSTGAARISSDQIREACIHYDAFDAPNHAKYLKDLAPELSGSKEGGYSLTARGLTSATELIREMLAKA